jgi:hypothetical protein
MNNDGESKREGKESWLDNRKEKHRDHFGDASRVRRPGNNNAEANHQEGKNKIKRCNTMRELSGGINGKAKK